MKKIAVMLSGGIDSSVSAFLLLRQGYEVVGLTAKLLNQENYIPQINAKTVADFLKIEHFTLDLTSEFGDCVINYFKHSYQIGETPNPCCVCNCKIKWGKLLDYAINTLNCDCIATGHYASVRNINGIYKLFPAKDLKKDQIYFLYGLSQEQLSKTVFPLSDLTKDEVREIALRNNIPSKSAKESQDICFIQKPLTSAEYISQCFGAKEGDIRLYSNSKKLGSHDGFYKYTLGQRKGLNVSYSEPLYIKKIDANLNTIYLAPKSDIMVREFYADNLNFFDSCPLETDFRVNAKIRYNMPLGCATANIKSGIAKIVFDEPVLIQSKGQIAVLYDLSDGHIILGGVILR